MNFCLTPYLWAASPPCPESPSSHSVCGHLVGQPCCPLNCPPALRLHCGLREGQEGQPRAGWFLSSPRVPALCLMLRWAAIPPWLLVYLSASSQKLSSWVGPRQLCLSTMGPLGVILPHPKRWGWPHSHPQTRHPPAGGGRQKHHDPGHWACSGRQSREATGFKQPCCTGPHALGQAHLWVDLWRLLLHWR